MKRISQTYHLPQLFKTDDESSTVVKVNNAINILNKRLMRLEDEDNVRISRKPLKIPYRTSVGITHNTGGSIEVDGLDDLKVLFGGLSGGIQQSSNLKWDYNRDVLMVDGGIIVGDTDIVDEGTIKCDDSDFSGYSNETHNSFIAFSYHTIEVGEIRVIRTNQQMAIFDDDVMLDGELRILGTGQLILRD